MKGIDTYRPAAWRLGVRSCERALGAIGRGYGIHQISVNGIHAGKFRLKPADAVAEFLRNGFSCRF